MTLYEVYLANGETVHVNAEGVLDALANAEIKFNIQAIDAYLYEPEPEFDRINHGPFEHPVSEPVNDQTFINNLEARHMSSWTEPEMARYNRLTGQE